MSGVEMGVEMELGVDFQHVADCVEHVEHVLMVLGLNRLSVICWHMEHWVALVHVVRLSSDVHVSHVSHMYSYRFVMLFISQWQLVQLVQFCRGVRGCEGVWHVVL